VTMKIFARSVLSAAVGISLLACVTSNDGSPDAAAQAVPPSGDTDDSGDAGVCARWPKSADTYDAATSAGCFPRATILINGSNACDGSEYGLVCTGSGRADLGQPDSSLGCRGLVLPGVSEFCCPCRE
jgi:hypothetical protein